MKNIAKYALAGVYILLLASMGSCKEKEGYLFDVSGTYSFEGVQREFETGFYASEWNTADRMPHYFVTATTDPDSRPGGATPKDDVQIFISENLFGERFNLMAPPEDIEPYLFGAIFRFDGEIRLECRFRCEWDEDWERYETTAEVENGKRIHNGTATITKTGADRFTMTIDIVVDAKRIQCDFTGQCKKILYK